MKSPVRPTWSPDRLMLRQAFLCLRHRHSKMDKLKLNRYASLCHQATLLLRAHGLAHVVAVLETGSSGEKPSDSCPREFIVDLCGVVHAGLGVKRPQQAPTDDQWPRLWRQQLCGGEQDVAQMDLTSYLVQSALALRAADAMKSLTEIVLGIERDDADIDAAAEGVVHA